MNAKINELAKKAGIDKFSTTHQKFAELILKETLSVVYDEVQYDCDFETAESIVTKIKNHFGIEILEEK